MEGAMKLAKRFTGRTEIVAFKNAYHGSTQGALSILGDEYWRNSYRPLLPDIQHLDYNSFEDLALITDRTACVIAEVVQAEAGVVAAENDWLQALRNRCSETGTLLVFDEIQTGFGRTGKVWGFEHFNIIPDVLLLGKALGGGMPLGAFIANKVILQSLTENPVLGHITTFGGHPVCCATARPAGPCGRGPAAAADLHRPGDRREQQRRARTDIARAQCHQSGGAGRWRRAGARCADRHSAGHSPLA